MISAKSIAKLDTCHHDLVRLVRFVAIKTPLIVLCGHRGKSEQNACFARGTSKLRYPNSRHNSLPSMAVDLAPDPLNWNDREAFVRLSKVVLQAADGMGISLEWGGHWKFVDLPHYQLSLKRKS